ncbi:MAG: glycosyltransferase family 4 protein [Thermodesulfobacteriota bacterium]|nr:glycosyltransferase family 4 protein [Thermodesulfobacteriota bacterium]
MKVLFLADVPLENPGSGSEQVLHHQAIGLTREGMAVYAITRQAAPPSWILRDVNGIAEGTYRASALDIGRSFFPVLKYPLKFYRGFTQSGPFDAAVCHQPFNCLSLLMTRQLQKVPQLYVFHSPSHEEYTLAHQEENWLTNLPHIATRLMIERFCVRGCAKIMVLSRYMKGKVRDIHGIPPHRIVVNPGGVDMNRFQPPQDREALKERLGFSGDRLQLLTVRNLEPRMGLDNLLKSIHILKKDCHDLHLTIVGDGMERHHMENLIEQYDLSGEVTMAGFVPSELLPQYYGAADFSILPTRHLEGFGLVTPESLACGTPVLGTPVGGTKEILSRFDSHFLFRDPSPEAIAEGIKWAVHEFFPWKKAYDALRLRCRQYALEHYSWERHVEQLTSTLHEML